MFNYRERIGLLWERARKHLRLVLLFAGVLWAVFLIDWAVPDEWLDLRGTGIRPRTAAGLAGVVVAPLIHGDVFRLLGNTVSLVVLGSILIFSGRGILARVWLVTALSSGLGAWITGSGTMVHQGSGGVVMGLLGFLLARGWFARRFLWTVLSAVIGLFYLGEVLGLLRDSPGISWSSHFWGFAGGIGMAWWLYGRSLLLPVPGRRKPGKRGRGVRP